MSKRDNGVSRRLRWGAGVAAVLVLGTGTAAAHALWGVRANLNAGTVASGSLDISTQWVGDWSRWKPLFPGGSSDTATLRVTETGAAGTTLRWRVTPVVAVSADLAPYITTEVFVGACGSATTIAAGTAWSPVGGLAPGHGVDLCVRVTLASSAPTGAQGADVMPSISVIADQVVA